MTQGLNTVLNTGRRNSHAHGTICFLTAKISEPSGSDQAISNPQITSALREAGFKILRYSDPDRLSHAAVLSGHTDSDLGLIDLRGCCLTSAKLAAMRALGSSVPFRLIFLIDKASDAEDLKQLAPYGEIIAEDDLTSDDPVNLFRDLFRMRTLNTNLHRRIGVHDHLLNRFNKQSRASYFNHLKDKPAEAPHVLFAGEPGPIVLSLINEVESHGGTAQCVYRPGQAIRALETGAFNAAIFLPRENGDPLNALARAIRRHQRFFTMPILNIVPEAAATKSSLRPGRQLTGDHICAKLNAILSSGLHRAAHYGNLVRQTERLAKAENIALAKNPELFTSTHLQSLLDQADHTSQPNTFVIIRSGFGTLEKQTVHALMLAMRTRIMNSVRKADFIMPLSVQNNAIIQAVSVGQQNRNDLIRIAGRLESMLRSSAICAPENKPLTMDISTQIFTRPAGLRLEETVAGMVQGLRAHR